MSTRAITAHVPEELAEQLDKISARMDRPKGWVIKQALTSWVALEEKRQQLTLDGLTDVKENHLVEHQSIKDWADGLDKTID